jgi:hypothetical protein
MPMTSPVMTTHRNCSNWLAKRAPRSARSLPWGWGAAGVVAGVTAASYYGYGYPYGTAIRRYPSCCCGYGGYAYPAVYSGWGY